MSRRRHSNGRPSQHHPRPQAGTDRVAQYLLLEQRFDQFEDDVNDKFDAIGSDVRDIKVWMQNRQPRLNVWIPSLAVLATGFFAILSLYIGSQTKPLSDTQSGITVAVKALTDNQTELMRKSGEWTGQNAESKRDRDDQRASLAKLTEALTKIIETQATLISEMGRGFAEIETQIDATAQTTDMAIAEVMRWCANNQNALADMGAKMPHMPNVPYVMPNISNRSHRAGKQQ